MGPIQNTPLTKCNLCSKPAHLHCSDCNNAPILQDRVTNATYCSKDCQKADWEKHKKVCKILKLRKILYRAGEILQEIFYVYREHVFDKRIAKIEKKNGKLYIHDRDFNKEEISMGLNEYSLIKPFPHEMCATAEDKNAVLVHLACNDAVAWMHFSVALLLSDEAFDISEIMISPRNLTREAVGVDIYGIEDKPFSHTLWKVTIKKTRENYAMDLAGAQYGWNEPIIPWSDFFARHIENQMLPGSDDQFAYFGGLRAFHIHNLKLADVSDLKSICHRLNLHVSPVLAIQINQVEERGVLMKDLLQLPLVDYEKRRKELVGNINQALKECIATLGRKAIEIKADTKMKDVVAARSGATVDTGLTREG